MLLTDIDIHPSLKDIRQLQDGGMGGIFGRDFGRGMPYPYSQTLANYVVSYAENPADVLVVGGKWDSELVEEIGILAQVSPDKTGEAQAYMQFRFFPSEHLPRTQLDPIKFVRIRKGSLRIVPGSLRQVLKAGVNRYSNPTKLPLVTIESIDAVSRAQGDQYGEFSVRRTPIADLTPWLTQFMLEFGETRRLMDQFFAPVHPQGQDSRIFV